MRNWIVALAMLGCTSVANAECYKATVMSPSPFLGNHDEVIELNDGTLWRVQFAYEYLYEYLPSVVICPDIGSLIVKGKEISVEQLSGGSNGTAQGDVIKSKIDGEFQGFEAGRIFLLQNGQIWKQVSSRYRYRYKYSPTVRIFKDGSGYEMSVEGMDDTVRVQRLK